MSERVYPSAKPAAGNGGASAAAAANPTFPANKSHLYNPTRLPYRPPRRRRRSCCLWTTAAVLLLLLAAAISAASLYAIYRPRRPSFSVDSLRLSAAGAAFNISVTARNPNAKIAFDYDRISVRLVSGDVDVGDGSFAGFTHGRRNATTMRTVVPALRSSGVKSGDLLLKIEMETKVKMKAGRIETKKLKIRVTCDGIRISNPNAKTTTSAAISNAKCKVDPRVKIIKWTV